MKTNKRIEITLEDVINYCDQSNQNLKNVITELVCSYRLLSNLNDQEKVDSDIQKILQIIYDEEE